VATVLVLGAYLRAPTQAWLQPVRSTPVGASQNEGLRRRQLLLLLPGAASFIGADQALGQTTSVPSGGSAATPDLTALLDPALFGDFVNQALNGTIVGPDGVTTTGGNSGLLALALGAGILLAVFVPLAKFLIAGASTLLFLQVADERFTNSKSTRRQGQGTFEKIFRKLSGEQEDAIDARSLEVRRLNDELVGLQANLIEQADGQGAADSLRERRKAKRFVGNWDATIDSLGITEEERLEVEDAVRTFREEVQATDSELATVRQRWRKTLLSKGDFTAPVSSWVKRAEALNKHEKIYKGEETLLKELQEMLPEDKYDALRKSLSEKDDLAWLSGGSQGSNTRKRAYVLSFDGDLGASRAKELSREISTILSAPGPQPEEVVLLLRSPGGSVTGYGLAAAELLRLRHHNPPVKLTVCVDELAASGGYLMACCADRILCSPFAAVGSIGVIATIPNAAKRLEREGLNFIETTAGKWKRTVTPFRVPSEEDLAKQKEDISAVYRQFSTFVHKFRPHVDIEKVATGEVWYGPDAIERDLVDELKTSAQYLLELMQEGVEVYSVSFKASSGQQGLLARGADSGLLKDLLQRELGSGSTPGGGMLDRLREFIGGLAPGDFLGRPDGRPMFLAEEERLAPQILASGFQETDASLSDMRAAMRRLQPEVKQRLLEELLASESTRL